jgi:hypothetical protein
VDVRDKARLTVHHPDTLVRAHVVTTGEILEGGFGPVMQHVAHALACGCTATIEPLKKANDGR